jgi:hypothetical protein
MDHANTFLSLPNVGWTALQNPLSRVHAAHAISVCENGISNHLNLLDLADRLMSSRPPTQQATQLEFMNPNYG